MSINLMKNRIDVLNAYNKVTNPQNPINWALYGYEGTTNVLRLEECGDGGIEELYSNFNSGRVEYALCRFDDASTNLTRLLLIQWQGECVATSRLATSASHVHEVGNLFKGVHGVLHARSEDEVEPEAVHSFIRNKCITAGPSSRPGSVIENDNPGKTGTSYTKWNPKEEIKGRNDFWTKNDQTTPDTGNERNNSGRPTTLSTNGFHNGVSSGGDDDNSRHPVANGVGLPDVKPKTVRPLVSMEPRSPPPLIISPTKTPTFEDIRSMSPQINQQHNLPPQPAPAAPTSQSESSGSTRVEDDVDKERRTRSQAMKTQRLQELSDLINQRNNPVPESAASKSTSPARSVDRQKSAERITPAPLQKSTVSKPWPPRSVAHPALAKAGRAASNDNELHGAKRGQQSAGGKLFARFAQQNKSSDDVAAQAAADQSAGRGAVDIVQPAAASRGHSPTKLVSSRAAMFSAPNDSSHNGESSSSAPPVSVGSIKSKRAMFDGKRSMFDSPEDDNRREKSSSPAPPKNYPTFSVPEVPVSPTKDDGVVDRAAHHGPVSPNDVLRKGNLQQGAITPVQVVTLPSRPPHAAYSPPSSALSPSAAHPLPQHNRGDPPQDNNAASMTACMISPPHMTSKASPALAEPAVGPPAATNGPTVRNLLATALPPQPDSDSEPEDEDDQDWNDSPLEDVPARMMTHDDVCDARDDTDVLNNNVYEALLAPADDDGPNRMATTAIEDGAHYMPPAGEPAAVTQFRPTPEQGVCAMALWDYDAADDTEISFNPDDLITNIEKIDVGWWQGVSPTGRFGLFPANYVQQFDA